MAEEFLKFCSPAISQHTIDEVVSCLKSGWLATGPRVKQFEENLKNYLNSPYVLALNSATAGLHLALKCMGVGKNDEVITTPMTFVASLNAIVHNQAKPILVDIDLNTRNIDINKIVAAITPRTKVIMPVHFAGIPTDLDKIYAIAQKYNLRVLEDCAHAIGTIYEGKILGSFGDTQVFSFHPNKVMTTGEGGAVATRDEELARKISIERFHGIDREAWNRYSKGGNQHYDVIEPGYKYNMMDLQAAIGIHQLTELEDFIAKRQQLVTRYNEQLADWPELILPSLPSTKTKHRISWYIYAPLINKKLVKTTRDEFILKMQERNIGIGYHHHAAHLYNYYAKTLNHRLGDFPNAETVSENICSLPLFASMTFEDQDRIIDAMKKVLKK